MFTLCTTILFIDIPYHDRYMATAKTGSFYLTETITLPAGTASGSRVQGTIDFGADFNTSIKGFVTQDGSIGTQLTDLNPGTAFVRADDQSLIASSQLNIDFGNNQGTHVSDLYPDNYGPTSLSEAFLVVNDSLYLVSGVDNAAIGPDPLFVTARIKCRVAKLSSKDWMAIAIQSTASDN
jgi:hypothetical protein